MFMRVPLYFARVFTPERDISLVFYLDERAREVEKSKEYEIEVYLTEKLKITAGAGPNNPSRGSRTPQKTILCLEGVRQLALQLAGWHLGPGVLQQPGVKAFLAKLLGPGGGVSHQGVPPPSETRPIPRVIGHLAPAVVAVTSHDLHACLNLKDK